MSKKIVLAGGCWELEDLIRQQPGVINTEVGYIGGKAVNPTYEKHEGRADTLATLFISTVI